MRPIDADELLTAFPIDDEPMLTKSCVRMTIQHMPTIESDAQPVRHGHWIEPSRHGFWRYVESAYRECDQCHTPVYLAKRMKFCPECGARMDEVK